MSAFIEFPKIARLSREAIITEKIDGTNAQILIEPRTVEAVPPSALWHNDQFVVYAGSRSRWILPMGDNHQFALWCLMHVEELVQLGPGRHYGEWWGNGIQRGYGLPNGDKRLSLFNVTRWCLHGTEPQQIPSGDPKAPPKFQQALPPCVGLVPVLWRGVFDTGIVDLALAALAETGSMAAPGYMNPEGVVVYHIAGNVGFKKTILKDEERKGQGGGQ